MGEETLRLGAKQQRRAWVPNQVLDGWVTIGEAAGMLKLSERQVKRLKAAYRQAGPAALVHGNEGRGAWNAVPAEVRARVIELARGKYAGFNHRHVAEKLAGVEQLGLSRATVRRILLDAGEASPRPRRAPGHRRRRERMPREGMLLQADGSPHRWLGPDRPPLTLVGAIDDACGTVPAALFRAQEDAQGYLLLLREIVRTKGIPVALYVDRHGIFTRSRREPLTLEEELAGGRLPTQVGRALEELAIRPIFALSPQAKGRVERLWGTLQGRLVAELRLAGAATLDEANRFLGPFLAAFNARFGVPPAEPGPAYRPPPPGFDPDRVFCFKYERVVRPDNTVPFGGRPLQLRPSPERASRARARVEVHERLDGSLAVAYRGEVIATTPAPPDAPLLRARSEPRPGAGPPQEPTPPPPSPPAPAEPRRSRAPAPDHPWRRYRGCQNRWTINGDILPGHEHEWDASDYTYTAPRTLPAGLVTIRMTNRGHEPHYGQLLRLNDGVTFDELAAALQQEGVGALRLVSAEGGPAAIDPHRTDEVTLELKPGMYAIACFIPSPDGVPHLAKGMLKPLEVTPSGAAAATPPQVQGTFTMRDFSFVDLPDGLPAGKATYKVENMGPQPHELVILKLAPGKAKEDVQAWYKAPAGPPPFEAVGGINGLSMGRAGYMTLDLQPGTYVAICEVPDPASGLAHQHLGMTKAFTVR